MRHQPWLVLFAVAVVGSGCDSSPEIPVPPYAVGHRVTTDDGYTLSLTRFPTYEPKGRPVLLLHGLGANQHSFDIDERTSLARYLAENGRDTWTLSVRGTGGSQLPDPAAGRKPYAFDAFWQFDLPATIRYIRARTGANALDYVGHSMGGMLAYAYLSQGGEGLASTVILGSPTRLNWGGTTYAWAIELGQQWVESGRLPLRAIHAGMVTRLYSPLAGLFRDSPWEYILGNPDNMTRETLRRGTAVALADIQWGVVRQFASFATGEFRSADGRIDFRSDMKRIKNPVLVMAAKADRIANVMAVHDGFRALGGPKEWQLMGVETGTEVDYGHIDLVTGKNVRKEIYPRIIDFFRRHDPGQS